MFGKRSVIFVRNNYRIGMQRGTLKNINKSITKSICFTGDTPYEVENNGGLYVI